MTRVPTLLRYRGREGMWSWVAHRVTGVLIFFFLFAHVLDTALVRVSPDSYNRIMDTYKTPLVNLMEVGLFGAVLFHALNGLRIIVQDFWPMVMQHQRTLAYAAAGLTGLLMLPVAWIMLAPLFGLAEEPGTERHRRRMEQSRESISTYQGPAAAQPAAVPPISGGTR